MKHFYTFSLSGLKPLMKKLTLGVLFASIGFVQEGFAQSDDIDEPFLYGFKGYSANSMSEEPDLGLYTINSVGETTMVWPDKVIGVTGTYISVMWLQDSQLHTLFGNKSSFFHLAYNFENGDLMLQEKLDVSGENAYKYIRRGAYNPNDGYIYGYSWNTDETQDYFVKAPASDPSRVTIIREMPKDFVACSANCFNPEDNCMYGIDIYKSLIRVDVHGNFSYTNLITPVEMNLHGVVAGLTYSPRDKCFYWNARYENYSSELVRIDPTKTREVNVNGYPETYIVTENVTWFEQLDAYVSLFTLDTTGSPDGPVDPEMVSYNFPDGATSGSIVYKMPTLLANGEAAPASMKWEATDGDATNLSGTAAPGEEVTVEYANLENKEYTFWFRAYSGDNQGVLNVHTTWVGNDIPSYPTDVTFEPTGNKEEYIIKWKPVTTGAHNGYFDKNSVVYAVYLNGDTQIATVKGTEAIVKIENEEDMMACFVTVYAVSDTKISEPGYSPTIYIGNGWQLPFTIIPTELQVSMMTYINPEGDSLGWRPFICPPDIPTFYTGNSDEYPGNDWLITPQLQFPSKDAIYELSYHIALWNEGLEEDSYDIWIGPEPTAEGIMMQQILDTTAPETMAFKRETYQFSVPEAGSYYIGFRCRSEMHQGGILLKNIEIRKLKGSSVEETEENGVFVYGGKGQLSVMGADNLPLDVYSLDGTSVYSGEAGKSMIINVRPGIYVVVCDGKSHKVIVK